MLNEKPLSRICNSKNKNIIETKSVNIDAYRESKMEKENT